MQKRLLTLGLCREQSRRKLLMIMKLIAFFLLVVCLQVSATGHSQKISIKISRVNLEKAFSLIEKQTNYRFVYNDDYLPLNKRIHVEAYEWTIEQVLQEILTDTKLGYRMMANNLVVIAPTGSENKDVTVTGRVLNSLGEPLSGVSIQLKNSSIGTTTNEKGEFEMKVPENGVLLFSFVGYVNQEIILDGRTSVSLTLAAIDNTMNEVVVVGYGSQKKMNVTGAVDQVSGKELAKRPIANIFQGLQGASPGLNIAYSGGRPGSTPNINIRGVGSIVNSSTPLIVIDGIAATTDDFLRLNPNDVGTITVLRDGASAAIYGARAAFGVILITTKQGASGGRQRISYNNYFSWSRRTVLPDMVTDPYIYSRVLETSTENTPWHYVQYTPYQYQWAKERSDNPSVEDTRIDPDDPNANTWIYMGNNNWNDYFFNKTSFSQNHSLSFSGGSEIGKGKPFGYLISTDYTKENGLNKLAKDDWNRYGLRARLNFTPINGLKFDNNLNVYQTISSSPSYSITDLYYLQPTQVAKNPDGTWANTGAGRLGAQLTDGGRYEQNRFGFQNIFKAVASFLNNDLQITGSASFKRELWKYNTDFKKYKIGYGPRDIREEGGSGSVSVTNGSVKHDVYDLYANYTKRLGNDHEFKLLAGYNQEEYIWSFEQATRDVLISSSLPYIGLTTGNATLGADYTTYALRGYFGRFNYTYKGRYIIEANGRYDGSSRFLPSNRWGFFPSISGAWIASDEPFFQSTSKYLSTLKFRASYGDLGNQVTLDFRHIPTLPIGSSPFLINNGHPSIITGAATLPVDPDSYTWERVSTFNVGADIGVLNDKFLFGFDIYTRDTKGMLTQAQALPEVLGTNPPPQNAANLSTKGWELSLAYRDNFSIASKPFSINARFIISDSRTKITKYDKNPLLSLSDYRVGQYTGEIWGLENNGYFNTQAEIDALDESEIVPWGALAIVQGWPKYIDQNKDGKITSGSYTQKEPGDYKLIGNNSARYRYGFNLDMDWNNFDLSVFIQGVGKKDFYPKHYLFWGPYQQPYAGIYPWNLDFYRGSSETGADRDRHSASYIAAGLADANTNSYFPVLQSWLADANYGGGLDIPQTKYILNAAYLRIKNLTFGYTLPVALTKRYKISRLRLFVTGENLFEFSKIKKYFDPEAVADGYGWAYPFQRKYAAGINLDF